LFQSIITKFTLIFSINNIFILFFNLFIYKLIKKLIKQWGKN
jgi:hypothetical protein